MKKRITKKDLEKRQVLMIKIMTFLMIVTAIVVFYFGYKSNEMDTQYYNIYDNIGEIIGMIGGAEAFITVRLMEGVPNIKEKLESRRKKTKPKDKTETDELR